MNINLLYDIPNVKVDKAQPYFNPNNSTIILHPVNNFCFKYYLEAIQRDNYNNPTRCIIFSRDMIHQQCRRCKYDSFGRIKLKIVAFSKYLREIIDKPTNITMNVIDTTEDYVSLSIDA